MNPAAFLGSNSNQGHLSPLTRKPSAWHEAFLVKRRCLAFVLLLSIFLSTVNNAAKAGPFQDFFRTLRSAVNRPKETPRPRRSTHNRKKTPPSDASNNQLSQKPTPAP